MQISINVCVCVCKKTLGRTFPSVARATNKRVGLAAVARAYIRNDLLY